MFTVDNTIQGVLRGQGSELAVSGATSPVDVAAGEAIVDGTWYDNSGITTVVVPTPATLTRIDLIVLEKDWTAQTIRLARVAGAEGGAAPTVTQIDGTTWEIKLAEVSITTGGAITVTDFREFNVGLAGKKIENVALADNDTFHYRTGSGTFENNPVALNTLAETTDPDNNDDTGDGYSVGSIWVNVTLDRVWKCVDAIAANAIWDRINFHMHVLERDEVDANNLSTSTAQTLKTYTIPGNTLGATDAVLVDVWGEWTDNAAGDIILFFEFGATEIARVTNIEAISGGGDTDGIFHLRILIQNDNSVSAQEGFLFYHHGNEGNKTDNAGLSDGGTSAIDTTSDADIVIRANNDTSSAVQGLTVKAATVIILREL